MSAIKKIGSEHVMDFLLESPMTEDIVKTLHSVVVSETWTWFGVCGIFFTLNSVCVKRESSQDLLGGQLTSFFCGAVCPFHFFFFRETLLRKPLMALKI